MDPKAPPYLSIHPVQPYHRSRRHDIRLHVPYLCPAKLRTITSRPEAHHERIVPMYPCWAASRVGASQLQIGVIHGERSNPEVGQGATTC